jgi:TRAP-type C4-dicarboxylate transport system permease small subunit
MSWVYVIIPVSCILMLLYLLKETIRIVKTIAGRDAGQEG